MIRLGQLPVTLKVGKKEWKIRTDYRDILVIMQAFNDPELTVEEAHVVMCKILYEGWTDMPKELYEEAAKKALWFLDCGQEDEEDIMPVKVMDWEQDEPILFPAINQVAGCEVRSVPYIHWWTFVGYFMEIREGIFSTVLGIRQTMAKGKHLEKWEREFRRNNKKICDLKKRYTKEEQEEIDYWNKLLG